MAFLVPRAECPVVKAVLIRPTISEDVSSDGLRVEGFGDGLRLEGLWLEGFGVAGGLRLEGSGVAAGFLLEGFGVSGTFGLEGFGVSGTFGLEGLGVESFRLRRRTSDWGSKALECLAVLGLKSSVASARGLTPSGFRGYPSGSTW